jgi:hypothetical protein
VAFTSGAIHLRPANLTPACVGACHTLMELCASLGVGAPGSMAGSTGLDLERQATGSAGAAPRDLDGSPSRDLPPASARSTGAGPSPFTTPRCPLGTGQAPAGASPSPLSPLTAHLASLSARQQREREREPGLPPPVPMGVRIGMYLQQPHLQQQPQPVSSRASSGSGERPAAAYEPPCLPRQASARRGCWQDGAEPAEAAAPSAPPLPSTPPITAPVKPTKGKAAVAEPEQTAFDEAISQHGTCVWVGPLPAGAGGKPPVLPVASKAQPKPPALPVAGRAPPVPQDDGATCLVCLARPRATGFLHGPSVHAVACEICAEALCDAAAKQGCALSCPMCRADVERVVMLFQ